MHRLPRTLLALALVAAVPGPSRADAGTAPAGRIQIPRHTLVFKFGGYFPTQDSQLWEFNREVLTTGRHGYDDFRFGFEYGYLVANRLEASGELSFYEGNEDSVYRADPSGRIVPQASRFALEPLTAGLRWMPGGRYGRRASGPLTRPRKVVPFLSAGIGIYFWEFEMAGHFIDVDTDEVFTDVFYSKGETFGYTAAVGVEIFLSRTWWLQVEVRRNWARDSLGPDFVGFDDLDLGGWAPSFGFALRFS